MAHRIDQNGNKTQSPLTASETAAYKQWAASLFGASFVAGITDASQLAGVLNAPQLRPNPVPQETIPAASIAKQDVLTSLTGIVFQLNEQSSPSVQAYRDLENSVQGNPADPIALSTLQPYIAAAIKSGAITQAQVDALTGTPDPDYSATNNFGPLSALVFGSWLVVETSDAAALLAN